jgi:hypothetical protein
MQLALIVCLLKLLVSEQRPDTVPIAEEDLLMQLALIVCLLTLPVSEQRPDTVPIAGEDFLPPRKSGWTKHCHSQGTCRHTTEKPDGQLSGKLEEVEHQGKCMRTPEERLNKALP